MITRHTSCSILIVLLLAACGAPQAVQPTAAPSAPQQATPLLTATSPPPTTSAAAPPPATGITQPTRVPITQVPSTSSATAPASAGASPAAPPAVGERTLALREPRLQGDDVRAVQQRLLELGYSEVGVVDGVFGSQTETAVRSFQRSNDLDVDGVVGPQTRARLFSTGATEAVVPILVHDFTTFLLGGVQGDAWLTAAATAPLLRGGEHYRILSATGAAATDAIGSEPVQAGFPCTSTYTVRLEPPIAGDAAVAVGGSKPLLPRAARELPLDDSALQQVIEVFLQGKGITQPEAQITGALLIDLEGNGNDEVVVTATRLPSQGGPSIDAAAGDYSFVAVQQTVDGTPTLLEITGNYFAQGGDFVAPNAYRVLGVLDLNGDGGYEIVVRGAYYEGAYTSAFQVEGTTARELLTVGCGV